MDVLNDLKLDDLQVIGQSAEREIIFCFHTRKRRIICFDQHAVDERIRFEMLLDDPNWLHEDIDRIKSRACHGAIRFGDKLSLHHCRTLIKQLLSCKVPFRCAHSRCGVSVLESLDKILLIEKIRDQYEYSKDK